MLIMVLIQNDLGVIEDFPFLMEVFLQKQILADFILLLWLLLV